jgi:hypothetical protein
VRVTLTGLLAVLATLGCAGWVAYVLLPSPQEVRPRRLGWLVLGAWGIIAVVLVGAGLLSGGFGVALLGLALALALPAVRPWIVARLGGPDRRWALARAWEALGPVCAQEHPGPGEAMWARALLHELDALRTPETEEFIDLLQSHVRGKLDGTPSIDPKWAAARLDEMAERLFEGIPGAVEPRPRA